MRLLPWVVVVAAMLAAFAYWGIYTRAGAARFDEMAGMIPFFAGVASGVLLVVAVVWWWLRKSAA
jgi:hypothetical protein